jgi:predicted transcriptional regulator
LNSTSEKKVEPAKCDNEAALRKDEKSERLVELIKLMSDDKSVLIFNTIFLASGDTSEILRTRLKLGRKQYYSRMSRLSKAGLVKRQKGRYFVTAFGKVIYNAQRLLVSAVKNHWKLKAIDSLKIANHDTVPEEERVKIIELMIGNQQIKKILLSPDF